MIAILIILTLILLNGMFVAAEFAIVGASRFAISRRAEQGDRRAEQVLSLLTHPQQQDTYIATAQIGITLATIALGMYGEHVVADWLAMQFRFLGLNVWLEVHTAATIMALVILTYLHIVLGEMVPKSLALQRAETTALRVVPALRWLKIALLPLVLGLNGLGNVVLRLMGIRRQRVVHQHYYTPGEIEEIIGESTEHGLIRPESGRVLRELFDFESLTAGEVMIPRVRIIGIPVGAQPSDLRKILIQSLHTRYPIYQGSLDNIAGTIHLKSILQRIPEGPPVRREDARPVPYLPETAPLDEVMDAMRQYGTQVAVIMDEYGGTAGLATLEDLFEEVIGRVREKDTDVGEILPEAPGRIRVKGTARLDELGEYLEIDLPHAEVDTVSGLILTLLKRPPRAGDIVTYHGVQLKVTTVQGRGVEQCLVTYPISDGPQA